MLPVFATNRLAADILYAAFFIWLLPEVISSFTAAKGKDLQVRDRASGVVLLLCLWLGIFVSINIAFAVPSLAIPWHRTSLFAVGIFFVLAGVAFRWYAIRVLGKYFTRQVAIQPGQTVVENGPYRWIRHPSYSGALLTIFGLGLAFTNWLSLVLVLAIAFFGYSYRVGVEEKALVEALGEPYRQYRQRTKRFIPFVY
ncbi:MAG TPA: isoprenylcysteine carboxylmethyltransferase family protein [Anaerolineales bacterium]|nr:isoprenylcysteine carboxylmethyltransferase family protein [Anaerolineales bacterium]